MLTKLSMVLGVLLTSEAFAKEVLCTSLNIHSEERKDQYIKITPTTMRHAKFEICNYHTKECKNLLAGHYRVDNLGEQVGEENLKGAFKFLLQSEATVTGRILFGPLFLNPLHNYQTAVATQEIQKALKDNSCAMFVDDSEAELLKRMEAVAENLDFVPLTEKLLCDEEET